MELNTMRYTVLSYVFGGYDIVHEVVERDPNADYIMVTDDRDLRSNTWRIVYDPMPDISVMEKCYFVRFNPFRYANTELCIRLDASIAILRPLGVFADKMQDGDYDRCLMIHPWRNTMPPEYAKWVQRRRYSQKQADCCMALMRHMGYNMNYRGLYQGCFEILRNNRVNADINAMTFALLRRSSLDGTIDRIDQTMSSFVMNHLYSDRLRILPVSQQIVIGGSYMQWCHHNSQQPKSWSIGLEPYLFNKPVKVWTPE